MNFKNILKLLLASSLLFTLQGCGKKHTDNMAHDIHNVDENKNHNESHKDQVELYVSNADLVEKVLDQDGLNQQFNMNKTTLDVSELSEDVKSQFDIQDNDEFVVLVKKGGAKVIRGPVSDVCDEVMVAEFKILHKEDSSFILENKNNDDALAAITSYIFNDKGEVLPEVLENNKFIVISSNSSKTGKPIMDDALRSDRSGEIIKTLMQYGIPTEHVRVRNRLADDLYEGEDTESEDHMYSDVQIVKCKNRAVLPDDAKMKLEELCKVKPTPEEIDIVFEPNQVELKEKHQSQVNTLVDYICDIHNAEESLKAKGHDIENADSKIIRLDVFTNKTDNKIFAQAKGLERSRNYREALLQRMLDKGLDEETAKVLVNRVDISLVGDQYLTKKNENSCLITSDPSKYEIIKENDDHNDNQEEYEEDEQNTDVEEDNQEEDDEQNTDVEEDNQEEDEEDQF